MIRERGRAGLARTVAGGTKLGPHKPRETPYAPALSQPGRPGVRKIAKRLASIQAQFSGSALSTTGRQESHSAQAVILSTLVLRELYGQYVTGLGRDRGLPMLVRWLDYDPIAVVVLIFGIGAVSLLALTI